MYILAGATNNADPVQWQACCMVASERHIQGIFFHKKKRVEMVSKGLSPQG